MLNAYSYVHVSLSVSDAEFISRLADGFATSRVADPYQRTKYSQLAKAMNRTAKRLGTARSQARLSVSDIYHARHLLADTASNRFTAKSAQRQARSILGRIDTALPENSRAVKQAYQKNHRDDDFYSLGYDLGHQMTFSEQDAISDAFDTFINDNLDGLDTGERVILYLATAQLGYQFEPYMLNLTKGDIAKYRNAASADEYEID